MILKRKRSDSDLSPFSSSAGSYSSRDPSSSPTPKPFQTSQYPYHASNIFCQGSTYQTHQIDNWAMTINPITDITPQHLHSRTRKRFRDSRPDEHTVHENTYQKLFQAQRSPQVTAAVPRTSSGSSTTSRRRSSAQASLHEFWTLPDRSNMAHRESISRFTSQSAMSSQMLCEDCDACIVFADDEGGIDTEMGGTGDEGNEYSCRECRRYVCDMCAVVVMGEGRECLQCKTSRRKWVGGIGWMQSTHV